MLLLIAFGVGLVNQGRVRADPGHMIPATVPALMVLALLLHDRLGALRRVGRWGMPAATVGLVFLAVWGGLKWEKYERRYPIRIPATIQPGQGLRLGPGGGDYLELIRYIREKVPEGEPIFVGNIVHDRVLIGDLSLHFLSGRESPTKFTELHPGLVTTREVQEVIVVDLTRTSVRLVVLHDFSDFPPEPNGSSVSSGVKVLDRFILRRFAPREVFGRYAVWEAIGP